MITEKIKQLEETCSHEKSEKFVLPDQLKGITPSKIRDIKYIIVGDNPGKEECALNRYFIGNKTNYIRTFFEKIYGKNYERYILFLNKTPVHTNKTVLLKGHSGIEETQKIMAELICDIERINSVPIWIMGHSHLKDLFKAFWLKIKDMNNVFVFNHPSRTCFLRDVERALERKKVTKDEFCHFSSSECEEVLKKIQGTKLGHKEKYLNVL